MKMEHGTIRIERCIMKYIETLGYFFSHVTSLEGNLPKMLGLVFSDWSFLLIDQDSSFSTGDLVSCESTAN